MNQVLKDRAGRVIGKIVDVGNRQYIVDVAGRRLGYFDGKYTYESNGRSVGEGNLLTTFLTRL